MPRWSPSGVASQSACRAVPDRSTRSGRSAGSTSAAAYSRSPDWPARSSPRTRSCSTRPAQARRKPEVRTVTGRPALRPEDGPLFVVVGVFDGLHLGHAYLIDKLVREARARSARPTVVTFDAHPDAVLLAHAPPLLMDAAERLE